MGGWGGGLEAPHEAPHILECKGTTALMGRGGGQSREMSCHVIRSWSEQFAIEGRAKERERETERSGGGGGGGEGVGGGGGIEGETSSSRDMSYMCRISC